MAGRRKNRNVDWGAAERLDQLMADRGWTPRSVEIASERTGHPQRRVSARVVYRVVNEGHKPTNPIQFEIAAAFGLLPSQIWHLTTSAARTPMVLPPAPFNPAGAPA